MKIDAHWRDVPGHPVEMDEAKGVTKRLVQGPDDGVPTAAFRVFTLAPGGQTPFHTHPWEHQNVVLEGAGVICTQDGEVPVSVGATALILPEEPHCFRNTGDVPFSFLCVVPKERA